MRFVKLGLAVSVALILCNALTAQAAVFRFVIFDFNGGSGGSTSFFEDYTRISECMIEVQDSAIAPDAFIDFQGLEFTSLKFHLSAKQRVA